MLRNGFAWEFSFCLAAAIFNDQETPVSGDPACCVFFFWGGGWNKTVQLLSNRAKCDIFFSSDKNLDLGHINCRSQYRGDSTCLASAETSFIQTSVRPAAPLVAEDCGKHCLRRLPAACRARITALKAHSDANLWH